MLLKRLLYLLVVVNTFSACVYRQAFYVSPFNGHAPSYHTIPVKADSISSALYAGAVISVGSANRRAINKDAGSKVFYGAGAEAGIDFVIPLGGGSEWRIIGVQTSLQKEFGRYLDYRKQLPDSTATLIIRDDVYATLGGYTEFIIRLNNNSFFGLKFAEGKVLGSYNNLNVYDNVVKNKLNYGYTNFTFSFTSGKCTGYLQTNFATKASAAMFGFNYRLAAKGK